MQHAAALRKAEALASPLLAYPWLPWKDEAGNWQKASVASPDFSSMTLADLPPPELYLQVGGGGRKHGQEGMVQICEQQLQQHLADYLAG